MPHPVVATPSAERSTCAPPPCQDVDCAWNVGLSGLDPTQRLGRLVGWLVFVEVRLRDADTRAFARPLLGWGDRVVAAKRSYDRAWWTAHQAEGAVAAAEAELQSLGAELLALIELRSPRRVDEAYRALAETPAPPIDARHVLRAISDVVEMLAREEAAALQALSGRYRSALGSARAAVKEAIEARATLRRAMSSVLATYDAAHALCHELEETLGEYAEEHGLGPDWARQRLQP